MWTLISIATMAGFAVLSFFLRRHGLVGGRARTGVRQDWAGGREYWAVGPRGKKHVVQAGIDIPDVNVSFSVRPELPWDKLAKAVHLAREVQTGDAAFDSKVYLLIEPDGVFEHLVRRSSDLRTAILDIMKACDAARFVLKGLHCRNGSVWIECSSADSVVEDHVQMLCRDVVPAMARIEAELKSVQHRTDLAATDRALRRTAVLEAILRGLLWGGALMVVRMIFADTYPSTTDGNEMLGTAFTAGAAGLIAYSAIVATLLGGTPYAQGAIFRGIVLGLPGCFLASLVLVRDINIEFDTSPAVVHAVKVYSKRSDMGSSKNPERRYSLNVQHWAFEHSSSELKIDGSDWARVEQGDFIWVTTHAGRLGFRWESGISFEQPPAGEAPVAAEPDRL